jgi:hypothetical protein
VARIGSTSSVCPFKKNAMTKLFSPSKSSLLAPLISPTKAEYKGQVAHGTDNDRDHGSVVDPLWYNAICAVYTQDRNRTCTSHIRIICGSDNGFI